MSANKGRYIATVVVNRQSQLRLLLERQSCRRNKCSYRRSGPLRTVTANRTAKVALGKLAAGRYRLSATLPSGKKKVITFTVRR